MLRARLDHAFDLFQRGLAPVLITTGGAASDPTFSEGGVGRDYLEHRGIPERSLIAETQGSDTAQSAVRVAVIMRANGLHSCVAVSDAYHVFRIKRLLEHEGIGPVYVAPRPDSRPRSVVQRGLCGVAGGVQLFAVENWRQLKRGFQARAKMKLSGRSRRSVGIDSICCANLEPRVAQIVAHDAAANPHEHVLNAYFEGAIVS